MPAASPPDLPTLRKALCAAAISAVPMLQDCCLKDFGERLTSLLRAAVLPAALSSHCYASFAPAAEHNAPAATPPAPLRKKLPSRRKPSSSSKAVDNHQEISFRPCGHLTGIPQMTRDWTDLLNLAQVGSGTLWAKIPIPGIRS